MNKAVLALALLGATPVCAQTVKDFVEVDGADTNPLTGVGVVLGLNGNGDSPKGPSATRLSNLLQHFSSSEIAAETLTAKNAALVFVTAELPPFAKKGTQIDVRISCAGDAKSIIGGELMITDLRDVGGRDREKPPLYAWARGRIVGQGDARGGNPTVGVVPNGATIYHELKPEWVKPMAYPLKDRLVGKKINGNENAIIRGRVFRLNLRRTDLTIASELANAINLKALRGPIGTNVGFNVARALDGGTVEVVIPSKDEWETVQPRGSYPNPGYYDDPVSWVQFVLNINVKLATNPRAVVTINDVTKTVVWTDDVKVRRGRVILKNGDIMGVDEEKTLTEAMAAWRKGLSGQDLIDGIRALDAAGLLVGRVESK
ncbi:MAG: flagellar basal body P-ring protein FlgI [Planctomycetes bacterium]|nr:flagellar basal body P-ring protein FlgI [Planctomycetota bacterium]